jgi:homocysteine S-methyltransferase
VNLPERLRSADLVLTEGAVIERLRRSPGARLDPYACHADFCLKAPLREALGAMVREYLDAALRHSLPMLVGTATWKAGREGARRCGSTVEALNRANAEFLLEIRTTYGHPGKEIGIGGLMGPKGDAYNPGEGLSFDEALSYHAPQAKALAGAGVDFLHGATLPAFPEARGMAGAMASTDIPYILSFVTGEDGCLLDGTPLAEAMDRIDQKVGRLPLGYMVNCVHPAALHGALSRTGPASRLLGLQGNTSRKSPAELEGSERLDGQEPEPFAREMLRLRSDFGLRILGGCCGTDARHIEAIAGLWAGRPPAGNSAEVDSDGRS